MKARLLLNFALQLLRHRQCVLQVVAHASRLCLGCLLHVRLP
jgi:hypothetical protein